MTETDHEAAQPTTRPRPNVLLIEDNPGDARLMREAVGELHSSAFTLHWVDCLAKGLDVLSRGGVDLVLLDLSLPDADGLSGLRTIKERATDIPIVVLTGLQDEETADRALRDGAQDFLLKGQVTGDMLARSVRYAIERNRADQALRLRETQLRQLQVVSDSALAHLSLSDLVDELLSRVQTAFAADTVALLLMDEERGDLVREAARGLTAEYAGRVSLSEGFSGRVATERRTLVIDEDTDESHLSPFLRGAGIKSAIGTPLLAHDRFQGVLHVGMLRPQRFTDDQIRLLELVADRVALAVENARLYRELQHAVDMRDQLLAVAAHDLRNPLASIGLRIETWRLKSQTAATVPRGDVLDQMDQIERATETMARLIDDLMDAAHMQLGRALVLNRAPWDLVEIVGTTIDFFSRAVDSHRHPTVVEAQQDTITGSWDRPRIERVLVNLLENAVKYSPRGGEITVCLGTEKHGSGDQATITVQDRGLGIPAADLPFIFDRFHRASNVGEIRGTGIGLSGARQIVEQHGGTIEVTSCIGEGTTFIIRLPLGDGISQ